MSAGNKIIPVRFNDTLLSWLQEELDKRNRNPLCEHMTISDYIRYCVRAELKHRRRGRSPRRKVYQG
jgi:hypothetical protein